MSRLISELGDLWDIVIDLLLFEHECCYNCQPYDSGEPIWLSSADDINWVTSEYVSIVCEANGIELDFAIETDIVGEAIDESEVSCPNCGTTWHSDDEIGDLWLRDDGTPVEEATHLLTKAYWPYLTHYTKPAENLSGLEVLSRIVNEGVIRGSSRYITGGRSVVSFTECSPLEIHALLAAGKGSLEERFSWSRSPHGVAIRRGAAIEAGTLPAIHGDNQLLQHLPDEYKYRFVQFDRRNPNNYRDWTFEREFRIEGDVSLTSFEPDDVIIIVANITTRSRKQLTGPASVCDGKGRQRGCDVDSR